MEHATKEQAFEILERLGFVRKEELEWDGFRVYETNIPGPGGLYTAGLMLYAIYGCGWWSYCVLNGDYARWNTDEQQTRIIRDCAQGGDYFEGVLKNLLGLRDVVGGNCLFDEIEEELPRREAE